MSVYVIARRNSPVANAMADTVALHGRVKKFQGKLLAADAHPACSEGEWPRDNVVNMEFPDDAAAREFQAFPEYQRSPPGSEGGPT